MSRRRPSPSLLLSILALLFAMSGTAYAATGGTFLLGRANTANAVTSLTNSRGSALRLNSTATTPPFTVSNSVQVPNLDASQLGGTPATGYMRGGGLTNGARLTMAPDDASEPVILSTTGSELVALCDAAGAESAVIPNNGSEPMDITWWNQDNVIHLDDTLGGKIITPRSLQPYVAVAQVSMSATISTYTVTEWVDASTHACGFTAQVVTTNG
jgi:hypothetical protein